jgi:RNA polymerase sigma-70 factor (ECF subfamily)
MQAGADLDQRRAWVLTVLDRYEIPLTRFARRLLGDEDAARDVVQHTFLRLCDRGPEPQLSEEGPEMREGRIARWLFTVCRNRAVDSLRVRQRMASVEGGRPEHCPGREPDPADLAERHDLYGRVRQVVDGLPHAQREAITLWAEGFRNREIAQIVGTTEGNVRVLVHRALRSLRQHPLARQLLAGPNANQVHLPRRGAYTVPL